MSWIVMRTAKRPGWAAAKDHSPHGGVFIELIQGHDQLADHGLAERIALIGAVVLDQSSVVVVDGDFEVLEGVHVAGALIRESCCCCLLFCLFWLFCVASVTTNLFC